MTPLNPADIRPPFGQYSHGVLIPEGARLVMTSGQLGTRPDDSIADTVLEQARQCFANITAILAEAGMGPANAVRINAFVTERRAFADYMAARDEWLAGCSALPASTLVIVTGFTRPEFLVEVEVTAAG